MKETKSKSIYVGNEEGEPIPAWWLGVITLITFALCSISIVWFILKYLP